MNNINTLDYWNDRFSSGDWADKGGFSQTQGFAEAIVQQLPLSPDFSGTLCDFGCGAGDAIPVLRRAFPKARLLGVDFSAAAIELATSRYAEMAQFYVGDYRVLPAVAVIVCSNVLEHLDDDQQVVTQLLQKCQHLFVAVPYREQPLGHEHVRRYERQHFAALKPLSSRIFLARGWSWYGWRLYYQIHLKNLARALLGRPLHRQQQQIMFTFRGQLP